MGIFSGIGKLFRRKKEPLQPVESFSLSAPAVTSEAITTENVKVKMDLVLAQVDSLRIQYESINERVKQIEKMVKELLDMAKS